MGEKLPFDVIQVVLIEDDLMVQEVNQMFVNRIEGFSITGMASNGKEGRQAVRKLKPDLVLLDIYMPKEDGIATISKLREEEEDVDIIAITAANDADTIKKLLRLGVIDYIVKPFTFERLKRALKKYQHMHEKLLDKKEFSQSVIDDVTHLSQKPAELRNERDIPKGLHKKTLQEIEASLWKTEIGRSAEEIAKDVGLARVTARRYLQYLEDKGVVQMKMNYGSIGRPVQNYSWIRKGDYSK